MDAAKDETGALEVRREDDGELCGYVTATADGRWEATTVFRAVLATFDDEHDARRCVVDRGLASVAERWMLVDRHSGDEQIVCIQQMSPDQVTLALDYYSLPGVPTRTVATTELGAGGRWQLRLA